MKWKWHSSLVGQYNPNSSLVCQGCVLSLIDKDIHLKTYIKQIHLLILETHTQNKIPLHLQITDR